MNLHHELRGLDWYGTSATAADPDLGLLWDGAREENGDAISVCTEVIEELTTEQWAVLWYSRPHYDLLVVPEMPEGLFTVVLLKDGDVKKVDESGSQMNALRAVIDFCATDHIPVNVCVTDRLMVPFDTEHLENTEAAAATRGYVTAAGSTASFASHDWALLPAPVYHAQWHEDQYEPGEVWDPAELQQELKEHANPGRDPVEA